MQVVGGVGAMTGGAAAMTIGFIGGELAEGNILPGQHGAITFFEDMESFGRGALVGGIAGTLEAVEDTVTFYDEDSDLNAGWDLSMGTLSGDDDRVTDARERLETDAWGEDGGSVLWEQTVGQFTKPVEIGMQAGAEQVLYENYPDANETQLDVNEMFDDLTMYSEVFLVTALGLVLGPALFRAIAAGLFRASMTGAVVAGIQAGALTAEIISEMIFGGFLDSDWDEDDSSDDEEETEEETDPNEELEPEEEEEEEEAEEEESVALDVIAPPIRDTSFDPAAFTGIDHSKLEVFH